MLRVEVTVETVEEAKAVVGVLTEAEENGELDFPFNVFVGAAKKGENPDG